MSNPQKKTPELGGNPHQGIDQNLFQQGRITDKKNDSGKPKDGPAEILMGMIKDRYDIHRAEDGSPFLTSKQGATHLAALLSDGAEELEGELADAYYSKEGKLISDTALRACTKSVLGAARRYPKEKVFLRVAQRNGVLWVDRGVPSGQVVRFSGGSWSLVPSADVCFRRTPLTAELPYPARQGSIDELWKFMNVAPKDRDLLIGCLVAAYLPDMAHPIVVMSGEQGTAKSSNGRRFLDLTDPSSAGLRTVPKEDDWVVTASNAWVIGIDNISRIPTWFSDALCRAVTGEADVRRKHYTNTGISVVSFHRQLLLTGIDLGELRSDLAERIVSFNLSRISTKNRMDEEDLQKRWEISRPSILAALFDLVAIAHETSDGVELADLPRMAKFAKVLKALDNFRGTDSLGRYLEKLHELSETVLASNPFVEELRARITSFSGTSKELLTKLDGYSTGRRPPRNWPQRPAEVTEILRRFAPPLRDAGWVLEDEGNRNQHKTIRWWIESPTAQKLPTSAPESAPSVSYGTRNHVTFDELLEGQPAGFKTTGVTGVTGINSPKATTGRAQMSEELANQILKGLKS
jgi:hypothetical protein